jgi:chloride channel protein, CIC family
LARRGLRVRHEYQADVLDMVTVDSVMVKSVVSVPKSMIVSDLIDKINQHDPYLTRHQALVIVDENDALCGIVTRGDLLKAISQGHSDWTVLEAGTEDVVVAHPDDTVRDALARMLQNEIGRLPVIDPKHPKKLVGYLSRASVMEAHFKTHHEENVVEPGWSSL